jgi:hypothetical protein
MSTLVKQLQAVHDELTRLMAEAKLDVPTRQKLAVAANQLADLGQQIVAADRTQNHQGPPASRPKKRSLTVRAMDLLAQIAALVERLMKRGYYDGS